MKVIIIEGTDNVGKDTVINRLTYEFADVTIQHCNKPKSITPLEQSAEQLNTFIKLMGETLFYASLESKNEDSCLIHNRSWYGEYVYGCMYRDNNPETVKQMIYHIENCINKVINPEDICFITLLSDNADFLVRNDDGLSISNADKGKIIHETHRFEEIFRLSNIKNKHIVYVNNGDKFRDKDDIYNEILGYIFNKEENSDVKEPSIDDFPGLKAVKDELLANGWKKVPTDVWLKEHWLTKEDYYEIKNADEVTDNLYKKFIYPNANLTAQQIFDIHNGIL